MNGCRLTLRKIIEKSGTNPECWHQHRAVRNPARPEEIVVCAESMWKDQLIDWAAYKGKGDPTNQQDILRVAHSGDKIPEATARKLFPDQVGRWRD